MSGRKVMFIGVPVIGLLAAGAIVVWPLPPSTVTISVAASPGTKITGYYEVDGAKSPIGSEAPTQFVVTGRGVRCWIQSGEPSAELSVRIAAAEQFASAASGPGQGVNVGFQRRGKWLTRSESIWANTSRAAP